MAATLWLYLVFGVVLAVFAVIQGAWILRSVLVAQGGGGGGGVGSNSPGGGVVEGVVGFVMNWAAQLELLFSMLSAWRVVSSMRGLFIVLFHSTRRFRKAFDDVDTGALLVAALGGAYVVGQLLCLRQSIIINKSRWGGTTGSSSSSSGGPSLVLLQALQSLPYRYYMELFDWSFLVGLFLTAAWRGGVTGNPVHAASVATMALTPPGL